MHWKVSYGYLADVIFFRKPLDEIFDKHLILLLMNRAGQVKARVNTERLELTTYLIMVDSARRARVFCGIVQKWGKTT